MHEILTEAGIKTVITGIRMPRMNSIMERWVQSCRRELLDRCLLWNEHHLRHALREYEHFYNQHRRGHVAIINISSGAATTPGLGSGVYGATKVALESLTRVWAAEYGPDGVHGSSSPRCA